MPGGGPREAEGGVEKNSGKNPGKFQGPGGKNPGAGGGGEEREREGGVACLENNHTHWQGEKQIRQVRGEGGMCVCGSCFIYFYLFIFLEK